jgi:hypothetical protein
LIDHSFETFLEWANSHLTSSHVLELVGARGFTAAKIIEKSQSDSQCSHQHSDKIKLTIIPVMKGEGQ